MEVEQQPTGVPDGWEVVSAPAAPAAPKGHDFKILGVNIHVPAEEQPRADSNIIGTASGRGIAPEDALMAGQAGRAIVGATKAGGAIAGAAETLSQAAPLVKYEATKTLLRAMHVPEPFAVVLAQVASGYKRGGKGAAEPVASDVPPPGVETAQDALARKMATAAPSASPAVASPAPPAAPVAPSAESVAPPPMPAAPPSAPPVRMGPDGLLVGRPGGNPAMPDQKALNEAALAARRSAVQTPAPAAKPTLNVAETKEFLRLVNSGKSVKDAMDLIRMQRQLIQELGTPTPTPAETRFPKGMRGGLPK